MSCGRRLNPTLSDCETLFGLSDGEAPLARYGRPASIDECKGGRDIRSRSVDVAILSADVVH